MSTAHAPETTHPHRWWVLAVLCLSVLLVAIDNTIVNVALPTMSAELNATTSQLQWIVDAYPMVFAGLSVRSTRNSRSTAGRSGSNRR